MRNLFSKSLIAAAAVMMFTSCSNEEVVVPENPYEGKTSDVTIAMSVKGIGSKASADNVNLGVTIQDIQNIVVVPMIGDAYQNPIKFGTLEAASISGNKGIQTVKATIPQSVTRFKVYGNVLDGYVQDSEEYNNISEVQQFKGFTFTAPDAVDAPSVGTYKKPHGLYYYADTESLGGFYVSAAEWLTTEPSWAPDKVELIGTNKSVKISPVNYAVGVIAALIKNGDNTTMFYDDDNLTINGNNFGNRATAPLTVTGITIAKQSQSFDANFAPSSDVVNVYETAAKTDIYKDDSSVNNSNRDIANIYSVVAPTTEENVTLNIEFEVAENTYFKSLDGKTVYKPGNKVYLPVVLNKNLATSSGTANYIFEADKATFLNAKVMNWGLVSENVVESADVTIGVEFDVEWGEGLQFDVEI